MSDAEPDFITRSLDTVDDLFDRLYDAILRPITLVGRTLAYALVLMALGIVVTVGLLLTLTRLLDSYVFAAHRWLTPISLGTLLVCVGLLLWRRRRPPTNK